MNIFLLFFGCFPILYILCSELDYCRQHNDINYHLDKHQPYKVSTHTKTLFSFLEPLARGLLDHSQMIPFFLQLYIDQTLAPVEALRWTGFMMTMVGVFWYRLLLGRNHFSILIAFLHFALNLNWIDGASARKVSTCIALASYSSGHPKTHPLQLVSTFIGFFMAYDSNLYSMVLFVFLVSILRSFV